MKILFANKYFYLKGRVEYVLFDSARLLENSGHKIIYFSMHHPKNLYSVFEKNFVSDVDYEKGSIKNKIDSSIKLLYSFEARKNIDKLLRHEKPDIAHLHNIYHQILPSIIHALKKFIILNQLARLYDRLLNASQFKMIMNNLYITFRKPFDKSGASKSSLEVFQK